jgi:hypothetical protein
LLDKCNTQIFNKGEAEIAKWYCKLKENEIILKDSDYFVFNYENNIWELVKDFIIISDIGDNISKELNEIINNINDDADTKKKQCQLLVTLTRTKSLKDIFSQCKTNFYNNGKEIEFDNQRHYISFKNGIYDLKENIFRQRKLYDYLTFYLNYDYNLCNSKRKEIIDIIKRICNDSDSDTEAILDWFGYCITGEVRKALYLLCVGHTAENGKSTLSKMFMKMFDKYSIELNNHVFEKNYSKAHKEIINCDKKRFVFIEELKRVNLDIELIKRFVDGNAYNTEKLFGTTQNVNIWGKIMIASNYDMITETDKGLIRRTLYYQQTNRFLNEKEYNDEINKKGIYIKNEKLLDLFEINEYRDTYVNMIIERAVKYYNFDLIMPKEFKENFKNIAEESDKLKQLLDNYYEITDDDNDRIHKDNLIEHYNQVNKTKVAFNFLLSDLKKHNIKYDKGKRTDGKKGSLIGLKIRENNL